MYAGSKCDATRPRLNMTDKQIVVRFFGGKDPVYEIFPAMINAVNGLIDCFHNGAVVNLEDDTTDAILTPFQDELASVESAIDFVAEDSSETGYEETLIVFGRAAFIFKQLERAKDGYRVLPETDAARQMKNIMKDLVKHLAAVFSPLEYPDCDLEDELIAEYLDCDLEDELIAEYKHRAAAVNPNHEEHYAIYGDSDDSAII